MRQSSVIHAPNKGVRATAVTLTLHHAMVEGAWTACPDYHEKDHDLIAEDDRVVVHVTISGTHHGQWGALSATGKRAQFDEIAILQIRDGKVLRQRGIVDTLSALRQLGAVPSPRS